MTELDFELPYYSKFLLLAAYICSRNKPTLDRRIFDPTSRTGKRHGQMSHDKQVSPGTQAGFPLLLPITSKFLVAPNSLKEWEPSSVSTLGAYHDRFLRDFPVGLRFPERGFHSDS